MPSEASDWYAVGVTLYEALTGRVPFDGSWQELCARKSHSDPLPPASLQPGHSRRTQRDLSWDSCAVIRSGRLSGRDALDKLADRGARDRNHVDGAAQADAVVRRPRAAAGHPRRVASRRSKRAVRRPSAFTAPRALARPRWSSGSSIRCRATMPWCFAADATSTRRCHMRPSTESSTV